MISRGVEIRIGGGGGEIVRVLSHRHFSFLFSSFFFFYNHVLFVLGTKSLMQREL